MKRLRVAVVGAGHLGRIHAKKLCSLPGARLVGVVDPRPEARRAVAAECKTTAFAELRDVADRIDAAVVAVPTSLHHAVGLELLRRGLHVLMEKPIAATVEQADELVAAAAQASVVLQVGHVERFNPALAPLLPAEDATSFEAPLYIEATRQGAFTGRCTDVGVVLDLMIHDIDLALALVQSPLVDVRAIGAPVLTAHEDFAHAWLVFADGCVAQLNASRVSPRQVRCMHVRSAREMASVDFGQRMLTRLVLKPDAAQCGAGLDALTPAERLALKDLWQTKYFETHEIQPPALDPITAELEDFLGAIRDARPPRVGGEQGRAALHAAHRILAAMAEHTGDNMPRTGLQAVPDRRVLPGAPTIRPPHWQQPALRVIRQEEE